jgi:hypothetical protein
VKAVSFAQATAMNINNEFNLLCQPRIIYSYVDTLGLFYERNYPLKTLMKLSSYGNRIICRRFQFGTWIQIQQPDNKILYLLRNSEEVGKIVGLDVAIDFESQSPLKLANYLNMNIFPKYKRKQHRQQQIGHVTYFREKRQVNRNIVVYGDKLSKVTGNKCAHLEFRVKGAQAIKRLGIDLEILIEGLDAWWLLNKFCRVGSEVEKVLKLNFLV